jgi:hypothetical protein
MKPRFNSVLSYLRVAIAGSLVISAAALGFNAVKMSSPPSLGKSDVTSAAPNKFRKDFDQSLGGNKRTMPGPGLDRGPLAAALENFALRAYPADDVSSEATMAAIAGFNKLKSASVAHRRARNTAGHRIAETIAASNPWNLVGPSQAIDPSILTFSGKQYVTSGRITALAISPTCNSTICRVWVGAAGGGVWRTANALAADNATWTFLSASFGTNAIGSLLLDPNDATGNTIYAGTGEPNASGDSEAGVGVYKSTDGGNTWALVPDSGKFFQRSIGQMAIDNGGNLLVPIASGIRGVSSVTSGASSSGATGHPLISRGVYRCNGVTCTQIFVAPTAGCGTRGSTTVRVDPTHAGIIYVNAFGGNFLGAGDGGIWRSVNNGTSFTQIFTPRDATLNTCISALERDEFDVTTLPSGATRMYVGAGEGGEAFSPPSPQATFWRSDNADTTATFASFGGAQVVDYCTGQCWYDNVVVTPKGNPNTVYLAGSFLYGEYGHKSNGRGVLYSTDSGATWSDQTWDSTTDATPAGSCCQPNPVAPNGIHPDQHALVVNPNNPAQFFEGSDGGLVLGSGTFKDISSQCAARGLTGASLTFCQGLLSRVQQHLFSLNKGLSTLQFQSLSVAADNPKHLQGGTQDNGTFETTGSATVWPQIIYGDGGQSGFSVTNSTLRFNTFTGQGNAANFRNGDPSFWCDISGPMANSPEGAYFYPPIIADPNPANAQTIYEGSFSVWRTQDWGGSQAFLEANCNDFTLSSLPPTCGDFVPLGNGVPSTRLTSGTWGDRSGGAVAWIQRTAQNTGTIWAATGTGRLFITDNANAAAGSVVWNRLDPTGAHTNDPNRAISAIYIDPTNAHHAFVSYNGYNVTVGSTAPGHVFDVNWSGTGAAVWTDISYALPDFPITALVRDDVTGDLYAGSDFGVMKLPNATTTWAVAGTVGSLPMVEVAGLTIVPSARLLYAATHGRSAWSLALP